jgi:hypothetical protein
VVSTYHVQWSITATFAALLGEQDVATTGGSDAATLTIAGLATGVPVYVRVAVRVTIRFLQEDVALPPGAVGPYLVVPGAITPSLPVLSRAVVQGGAAMSTTGLQTIVLTGTGLGLPEVPSIVAATYSNGNFTLTATGCVVTTDGEVVQCITAEGVGASYVWSLTVDGGRSVSVVPRVSAITLSYEAPTISSFEGPGAVGALTSGGQAIRLYGSQFGPLGSAYITRVVFFPTNRASFVLSAVNCSVSVAHVTIDCVVPRVAGARVTWIVTIEHQSSSAPSTSAAPPSITSVCRADGGSLEQLSTGGGTVLRIAGTNFCPAAAGAADEWLLELALVSTAGGTAAPATALLLGCNVTLDFVAIACYVPPGRGQGFRVTVSVMEQASAPSSAMLAYAPPTLTSISVAPTPLLASDGGQTVVITGVNFGVGALSVYACPSAAARTQDALASDCAAPLSVVSSSEGALASVNSPPLGTALAGAPFVWFYLVAAGQVSLNALPLPAAAPAISGASLLTLATALVTAAVDADTAACVVALRAAPPPTAAWSLLRVSGTNLGTPSALGVGRVAITLFDGGSRVSCAPCSLSSVRLQCVANLTQPDTRSGNLTYTLGGFVASFQFSLGGSPAPRLLSLAQDGLAGVIAVPGAGGGSAGLGAGDVLRLRFNMPVYQLAVAARADVDALLACSAPLGEGYSGAWVSPSELDVTVTVAAAAPVPAAATAVGQLRVTVLASGGLLSQSRASPPCTSSSVVEAGSWGDAVTALSVAVRTATSLMVRAAPPDLSIYAGLAARYSVNTYTIAWTAAASGGGATHTQSVVVPAGSMPVTLSPLTTGVPVSVTVSATLRVEAGSEVLSCAGPPVAAAGPPIAPEAPMLLSAALVSGAAVAQTRGGEDVELRGRNIGLLADDVAASYSNSGGIVLDAGACSVITPGTVLLCATAPGAGHGFAWVVTVGSATSNASPPPTLDYAVPVVASFAGPGASGAATPGGQLVMIGGSQFGPAGGRYIDRVLYTPARGGGGGVSFAAENCTVSQPHVEITCWTAPGAGTRLSWLIVIANQSSTTPTTQYAGPDILSVRRGDGGRGDMLPTRGNVSIVVTGVNFGPRGSAFISAPAGAVQLIAHQAAATPVALLDCTVAFPHTTIVCTMPAGVGGGFLAIVTVLGQPSQHWLSGLSYAPPDLHSISVAGASAVGGQLPTAGGVQLTFSCDNIGSSANDVYVYVCATDTAAGGGGGPNASAPCFPLYGVVLSAPHTTLVAPSPPIEEDALLGLTQLWFVVVVGSRASPMLPLHVAPPTIDVSQTTADFVTDLMGVAGLLPGQPACVALAAANGAIVSSSLVLTLVGSNLGASVAHTSIAITDLVTGAPLPCVPCSAAHTRVMCLAKQIVGDPLSVELSTGAQTTRSVTFSIALLVVHPSISSLELYSAAVAAMGDRGGGNRSSALLGGGASGTTVPTGGALLLVRGLDFKNIGTLQLVRVAAGDAPPPASAAVLGSVPCAISLASCFDGACGWGPDAGSGNSRSSIAVCAAPPGGGAGWYVVITVRGLVGVSPTPFSYTPPAIRGIAPGTLPAAGGVVRLSGTDIAPPSGALGVTVSVWLSKTAGAAGDPTGAGSQPCRGLARAENGSWISCTVPPRAGAAAVYAYVVVNGLVSNAVQLLYAPPQVWQLSPSHGNSSGGTILTLSGIHFGVPGVSPAPLVSFSLVPGSFDKLRFTVPAPVMLAYNDTAITVETPAAVDDGSGLRVAVTAGDAMSAVDGSAPRYSVDAPVVLGVSTPGARGGGDEGRPFEGGFVVAVSGANLYGLAAYPPSVALGGAPCAVVPGSVSAASIRCIAPPGIGGGLNVSVTLAGRTAVLQRAFAYNAPRVAAVAPAAMDERMGAPVILLGSNFAPSALTMLIDGQPCATPVQFFNASAVGCAAARASHIGRISITLLVAGQASNAVTILAQCTAGFYGLPGVDAACEPCPKTGAFCPGGAYDPQPEAGVLQGIADRLWRVCAVGRVCAGEVADGRAAGGGGGSSVRFRWRRGRLQPMAHTWLQSDVTRALM